MPGKKQVRLAFCDLAPDWDARDNYFTQALEHAGWEITFCNGPEEKPDFVLCGTFGFDFLKYDCCRIQHLEPHGIVIQVQVLSLIHI